MIIDWLMVNMFIMKKMKIKPIIRNIKYDTTEIYDINGNLILGYGHEFRLGYMHRLNKFKIKNTYFGKNK